MAYRINYNNNSVSNKLFTYKEIKKELKQQYEYSKNIGQKMGVYRIEYYDFEIAEVVPVTVWQYYEGGLK